MKDEQYMPYSMLGEKAYRVKHKHKEYLVKIK